jgi:hypothetical protein
MLFSATINITITITMPSFRSATLELLERATRCIPRHFSLNRITMFHRGSTKSKALGKRTFYHQV